jgi:GNAT superfamily N-acetyltransferase
MLPDGPSITYQVEPWSIVVPELEAHWKAHWAEIAHDRDKMPLDVDYETYAQLETRGQLHVVTVRVDDELVGYHITFVHPHPHYRSTLCGFADVYYIEPAYRQGFLAARLFRKVESSLRALGVQKLFSSCKADAPLGPLFRRLGWREADMHYTKWIGG